MQDCPSCDGSGLEGTRLCKGCDGRGTIAASDPIPASEDVASTDEDTEA